MSKHNETNLKAAIRAMLDHYKLQGRYQQTRLKQLWPTIMGPSIAQYTTDIKIYRNVFYVSISSAPLKQELSMGKDKIKKMLNEELGEDYVKDVVIR